VTRDSAVKLRGKQMRILLEEHEYVLQSCWAQWLGEGEGGDSREHRRMKRRIGGEAWSENEQVKRVNQDAKLCSSEGGKAGWRRRIQGQRPAVWEHEDKQQTEDQKGENKVEEQEEDEIAFACRLESRNRQRNSAKWARGYISNMRSISIERDTSMK
jgi:hypothetical protein